MYMCVGMRVCVCVVTVNCVGVRYPQHSFREVIKFNPTTMAFHKNCITVKRKRCKGYFQ